MRPPEQSIRDMDYYHRMKVEVRIKKDIGDCPQLGEGDSLILTYPDKRVVKYLMKDGHLVIV